MLHFQGKKHFPVRKIFLIFKNKNLLFDIIYFLIFKKGEIMHSVKFKSSTINKMVGKRVLVVGIGNSGVDITVNLYNEGRLN